MRLVGIHIIIGMRICIFRPRRIPIPVDKLTVLCFTHPIDLTSLRETGGIRIASVNFKGRPKMSKKELARAIAKKQ